MLAFSFWLIIRFQTWIMTPWWFWFDTWKHFDDVLDKRYESREHDKRMRLVERLNRQSKP
jgi:hypothetical protein